jgi:hypothetical protein
MNQIIKTVCFNDVTNILVDERCLHSFPCRHQAQIETKEHDLINVTISGLTVYKLLVKLKLPISQHFANYKDSQIENNTDEREYSLFL